MVFLSRILHNGRVRVSYRKFIDSLRIYVRGGSGGMGFPKYGGIGGKGGSVIVVAAEGELNTDGSSLVVAYGGAGGNPLTQYSGQRAEPLSVKLDLKLIADVGLVGFPNAGKSTLLRAISRAKPEVASYPFTTLRPNIGVLEYSDHRQITMADLPGLIEGAHMNIGMGHSFLKHVERTKLLLLVADIQGFQLGPQYPYRSCLDTVVLLNKELELYRDDLLDKPAMLVVNKMDVAEAQFKYDEVKDKLRYLADVVGDYPEELRPERVLDFTEVMAISADTDPIGVEKLKHRIREVLDFHAALKQKDVETSVIATLRAQMAPKGPQML
ncbi:GTP-binding protein 10 [Cryptotermes secundus]|uniref:GTP-binding protein 10 n=1 Tax=Cryptotermes secundus TaxID=105785 RepID=A0A2J7R9C3_9NEOP|nr:GTP-binding protein 10 [Cryptotermes secundus]